MPPQGPNAMLPPQGPRVSEKLPQGGPALPALICLVLVSPIPLPFPSARMQFAVIPDLLYFRS